MISKERQNSINIQMMNNPNNPKKINQTKEKIINKNFNSQINNIFQNSNLSFDETFNNSYNSASPIPILITKQIEFHPMKNSQMNYNINNINNNKISNYFYSDPAYSQKESKNSDASSSLNTSAQSYNLQLNKMNKTIIMNSLSEQKTAIILQKILMESSDEEILSIVHELKGEFRKLIFDKNGNFFCKDLFKICGQREHIIILKELYQTLSEDCCNNYATHPIQALIEFSSCEEEYKLILYSFNDYNKLLYASLDPNGAFVIQKIIIRIPERFRGEFNFIFTSFIRFVCKKKYGIVVVKKFIEFTRGENTTQQIMNAIKLNFMNFAVDNYGNYLIQFILEKFANFPEGKEIKNLIFQNFNVMCKSKYSSFICELYVKMLTSEEKSELIKTLDINSIRNSNNPNAIKILKYLSININNNFPSQMQLPLSLNNNSQSNFMNY
jgi:hypothetical protein